MSENINDLISQEHINELNQRVVNTISNHPAISHDHPELGNVIAEIQRSIARLGSNAPAKTILKESQLEQQKIVESNQAAESGE